MDTSKYQQFMEDYMQEEFDGMTEYIESMDDLFLEAKEGVYKDNYYLRDNLQIPYITKELAKPRVRDTIVEFVSKFLDDHVTQLSTSGPVHIFTFSDKETSVLYDLFKINDEKLYELYEQTIKETYYGNISKFITGWIKHAPHKLLITSMLIEALQKSYDDILVCCKYMWAFSEYPLVYRNFWKIGVKEEVMNYTIEHLSSKYKVTNMKNLKELLYYHADKSVQSEQERLKTGLDHTYFDFMRRMRNQMNNNFRNIANVYYQNDKMDLTQHTKDSQFDDGTLADQEGHTTNTARAIDNTISKFEVGTVDKSVVGIVAEAAKIDKDTTITYINRILTTKGNNLNRLIEDIITSFFTRNPTNSSLGTTEFLTYGLSLYRSIGTSKDPMYQDIKVILHQWMYDILDIRSTYSSEGTIINYTRAIFNYVIFMIHSYN